MTTPNNNNSQMHNDIMAAGSKDRPPMLATGRYAQWQSCFMIYVNTKPNMKELKKCIFNGPYVMTRVLVPVKPATEINPVVPEHTVQETYKNTLPENRAYIDAEVEAIHMILSGIDDEIYSTDVKTNLFWEFGKFTSRDGESIESYYSRFYKMMNEMPEWSRFVTVVKQTVELDKESYHKLFDILKQYQNKVNEIRAKKIAMNANPLALVAAAKQYPNDNYYHAPKPHKNQTTSSRHTSSTSSHAPTRTKGKEVAKVRTPPSLSISEDDNWAVWELEDGKSCLARETVGNQVVQQTEIQCFNCKEYGHFAKECRKPKRVKDYSYHKEKMMMCMQEEKGVPLSAEQSDRLHDTDEEPDKQELEAHYMYMAKIQEVLHVTDDNSRPTYETEPLEQVQTDNEYNAFAKERQHFEQPETINDIYVMETVDSNVIPDHSDMCNNEFEDDHNANVNDEDKRVELANLIENLKLDIDENKNVTLALS
ncbi:integrase, catalytic region, zinc finger, CCHC-type containing protein [Tanacetum coccineum]